MNRLIILLGLVFFFSCEEQVGRDKIEGVWVFDHKINNLHLKDTSGSFGQQYPVVYDFKENGQLVFKNYGYRDTVLNWVMKSDSILTIDSLDYFIYSLNQGSLSLIDYNSADTFWLTLKRPKEIKLDYSKAEIEKILLANVWSIDDAEKQEWAQHFEYFDNQTMIYRYPVFDRNLNDSTDNLLLETWGVAKYKDYYFLYSYNDIVLGNGSFAKINQIIEIDPGAYTVAGLHGKNEEVSFHSIIKSSNNQEQLEKIRGSWISHNTASKTYGEYPPLQEMKAGRVALFEGDLQMSIQEKTLTFKIDTLEPLVYAWQLSKDRQTLMLEYNLDEPERKGIHVEYADVLELTETKMKIRLFDNNFYTGLEKPSRYLLNLVQEFEKVE